MYYDSLLRANKTISALYGCLFKNHQEAAFANYRLFESIGFLVAFAYANSLTTEEKLYIVLTFLILGMIGYVVCEVLDKKKYQVGQPDTVGDETSKSSMSKGSIGADNDAFSADL